MKIPEDMIDAVRLGIVTRKEGEFVGELLCRLERVGSIPVSPAEYRRLQAILAKLK